MIFAQRGALCAQCTTKAIGHKIRFVRSTGPPVTRVTRVTPVTLIRSPAGKRKK